MLSSFNIHRKSSSTVVSLAQRLAQSLVVFFVVSLSHFTPLRKTDPTALGVPAGAKTIDQSNTDSQTSALVVMGLLWQRILNKYAVSTASVARCDYARIHVHLLWGVYAARSLWASGKYKSCMFRALGRTWAWSRVWGVVIP